MLNWTKGLININVVDLSGNSIEDAKIFISSITEVMKEVSTDENGNASAGVRVNETYTLQGSKMGI